MLELIFDIFLSGWIMNFTLPLRVCNLVENPFIWLFGKYPNIPRKWYVLIKIATFILSHFSQNFPGFRNENDTKKYFVTIAFNSFFSQKKMLCAPPLVWSLPTPYFKSCFPKIVRFLSLKHSWRSHLKCWLYQKTCLIVLSDGSGT